MALTPKEIVHNIITSGKNDDGVRAIEDAIADEREACAKLVAAVPLGRILDTGYYQEYAPVEIAEKIRARK